MISKNEALAIAQNLIEHGVKYVHFLGGEPLLYKPILAVTEALSRAGVTVTINTNGSLLTEELASMLIQAGIRGITISLDGASPHTNDQVRGEGAFDQATQGIRNAIAAREKLGAKTKVAIGYTLTRPGLVDIEQLIPLAISLQVDDINVQYLSDFGGAGQKDVLEQIGYSVSEVLEALEKLVLQARARNFLRHLTLDTRPLFNYYIKLKHGIIIETSALAPPVCEGGAGQINIRADGTVHPCSPADDTPGETVVAKGLFIKEDIDISKRPLAEALSSLYFTSFRRFVDGRESTTLRPTTCRGCPFQSSCMPCPLDISPHDPVDECEWVRSRLAKFERSLLGKSLAFDKRLELETSSGEVIFNNTGHEILAGLRRGRRLKEIADDLHVRYGIPRKQARFDVLDFAGDLVAYGYATFQ